ncbi:Ribosomal large subunit pseudouridine synthase B [Planctomycetaceae bacterium]|nr:Ribosomal large subunit pseudouridine synthase B [Planctomycetaceae bacterium]
MALTSGTGDNPLRAQSRIFVFHKPKGVTVTRDDERGAKTVYDVLPVWVRDGGWIPVGRLDKDTRGLLLFVQDGKLMDALSRPGAHPKIYEVWVRGRVTEKHVAALLKGVQTPLGEMHASRVEPKGGVGPKSRVLVTLEEGKNRQIRRLFSALKDEHGRALKVLELKRVQFGPLTLDLPSGQWRWLTTLECAGFRLR